MSAAFAWSRIGESPVRLKSEKGKGASGASAAGGRIQAPLDPRAGALGTSGSGSGGGPAKIRKLAPPPLPALVNKCWLPAEIRKLASPLLPALVKKSGLPAEIRKLAPPPLPALVNKCWLPTETRKLAPPLLPALVKKSGLPAETRKLVPPPLPALITAGRRRSAPQQGRHRSKASQAGCGMRGRCKRQSNRQKSVDYAESLRSKLFWLLAELDY